MVEAALLSPWIFFVFMGLLDFGFYAFALITTESAARAGAMYASQTIGSAGNGDGVCFPVVEEMRTLPNVSTTATCSCTAGNCTAGPITIQTRSVVDANCPEGVVGARCAIVMVRYTTVPMIPIPFLRGQLTVQRVAYASIRSTS